MKQKLSRFQQWMTAITFAEAGEWEVVRQMIPAIQDSREAVTVDHLFSAVAFAEAGEAETALAILNRASKPRAVPANDFFESIGLVGVRVTYGVFTA